MLPVLSWEVVSLSLHASCLLPMSSKSCFPYFSSSSWTAVNTPSVACIMTIIINNNVTNTNISDSEKDGNRRKDSDRQWQRQRDRQVDR